MTTTPGKPFAGIVLATLCVTASMGSPATASVPLTEEQLKERQASEDPASLWTDGDWWRDPKKWERKWDRMWYRWGPILLPDHDWTKQRRPGRGVIVLDPPMDRLSDTDAVQVELFQSPIDETGYSTTSRVTGGTTAKWLGSWYKWDNIPRVQFTPHVLGKGPTLLRRWNEHRLRWQEMTYTWTDGTEQGTNKPKVETINKALASNAMVGHIKSIATRADAEALMDRIGIDVAEWRAAFERDQPRIQSQIRQTNNRFRELMTRAAEVERKVLVTPTDPIILIDGKYLLMGGLARSVGEMLQMGNSIVAMQDRRIGKIEVYGKAKIIDGDELEIEGRRVKLAGVRVPTASWCDEAGIRDCTNRARKALRQVVRNRKIACLIDKETLWDERVPVGQCEHRSARDRICDNPARCDVSNLLAWTGWVVADADGPIRKTASAKEIRRGIWKSGRQPVVEDHQFEAPRWGTQREPKNGELAKLKEPFAASSAGPITVEWLYTYVDDQGTPTQVPWLEELLNTWSEGLAKDSIEVNLTRTPAAWSTGTGAAHQESHQRVIVAWADKRSFWQDLIHWHIGKALLWSPRSIATDEDREAALASEDALAAHWEKRRTSAEYESELETVRSRVARVEAALAPYTNGSAMRDPVLVVNGTYIVEGGLAGGTAPALKIVNWLIKEALENRR